MIQYKKYYMPGTKEELLKTIDTIDCTYDILAGGTDLYGTASYLLSRTMHISTEAKLILFLKMRP